MLARVAPRGSGSQEVDMSVTLCTDDAQNITARFVRNELLWFDEDANARTRHPDKKPVAAALILCDWQNAARTANLVVLNRGYHATRGANVTRREQELNATIGFLGLLFTSRYPSSVQGDALKTRIVYRGTHASVKGCANRADPETDGYDQLAPRLRSKYNAQYNWNQIEAHANRDRETIEKLGVPYMDTYIASALRPGGRMRGSCNHFCLPGAVSHNRRCVSCALFFVPPTHPDKFTNSGFPRCPGPIDDWARLLLLHWT